MAKILAKLVVGGFLIYLLLSRVNLGALSQALVNANVPILAGAFVALVFTVSLNALRWRIIVAQLGGGVSIRTALAGSFEGMFFNLFLPTNVGGDAARAYRAYDSGVTLGTAVASGLADRAVGLASVMGLLLLGSLVAPGFSKVPSFWLITAFSAVGLVAAVVLAWAGRALSMRELWPPLRLTAKALDAFATVIFSRSLVAQVLPITILANLANCFVLYACAQAAELRLTYPDAVVVLEASSLAAILPISVGGWGVREGPTAALLSALGNSMTASIAASVLYAGVLVAIGCVGAAVWIGSPYRLKVARGLSALRAAQEKVTVSRDAAREVQAPVDHPGRETEPTLP